MCSFASDQSKNLQGGIGTFFGRPHKRAPQGGEKKRPPSARADVPRFDLSRYAPQRRHSGPGDGILSPAGTDAFCRFGISSVAKILEGHPQPWPAPSRTAQFPRGSPGRAKSPEITARRAFAKGTGGATPNSANPSRCRACAERSRARRENGRPLSRGRGSSLPGQKGFPLSERSRRG